MDEIRNVETQVVGELDRRLAEEREAISTAAAMTADEAKEAGVGDVVAEMKEAAREATGKKRPRPDEVAAAGEAELSDQERQALAEALLDTKED